jgi:hypothetical protein
MTYDYIERLLTRGKTLGFLKQTESSDRLGWILLTKQEPHDRYLALLKPGEDDDFVYQQKLIRQRPYLVRVVEMAREQRENYSWDEEFLLNENHRFGHLSEVEEFVRGFGHRLEDIQPSHAIDAP